MENYIKNRYDFVFIYDVKDGNPNGDPDMDNQPRIDFETREGLVSDVCIKRKVRNYIQLKVEAGELDASKYGIFIRQGNILNNIINKGKEEADNDEKKGRMALCDRYFDVRTFGAVLSTGNDLGVVRGPVQFVFSRSIDAIDSRTHSLTRCCITDEKDADKDNTFGNKSTVSYGLYRMHGYVSAFDGEKCHFTEEDLKLLWEALANAFEHDHAAARGEMNARALVVFKHNSKLGNARSAQLFDLVKIEKKDGVEFPRSFEDYDVTGKNEVEKKLEELKLAEGISVEYLI